MISIKMSLLKEVEENKDLREIFGKRELEIIKKQLKGTPLKYSEQVRLSRDIRKKFEVIKQLSQFSKEFGLKWKGERKGRPKGSKSKKKQPEKKPEQTPIPKPAPKKDIFKEAQEIILKDQYARYIRKIYKYNSALIIHFSGLSSRNRKNFIIRIKPKVDSKVDVKVYGLLRSNERRDIIQNGKIVWEK